MPLRNGFWLDETQTVWIIQSGLRDILSHCITLKQPPAYFFIAGMLFKVAGSNEVLLRMPSILAMAASSYLLFLLSLRLAGREAAWPTVISFASLNAVAFAAADARPYAIGMLAVVGAMFLLVRWFDTGNAAAGIGYCLLAGLSVYIHYFFVTTLFVHLIYAIYRTCAGNTGRRRLWVATGLLAGLFVPAALLAPKLLQAGRYYPFTGSPGIVTFFSTIAPPVLLGSALGVLLLFRLTSRDFEFRLPPIGNPALVLFVCWTAVPCIFVFGLSAATHLNFFMPRYLLPFEGGLALLGGWAISAVKTERLRLVMVGVMVLATLLEAGLHAVPPHNEDWRAAMAAERSVADQSDIPVLVRSPVFKSRFKVHADEERRPYLFTPLSVYPAAGHVLYLPNQLNPASIAYLEEILPSLQRSDRFLFVNFGDDTYETWLLGRMAPQGIAKRRVGSFGEFLTVDLFYRSAVGGSGVLNPGPSLQASHP
jgi:mannosyltransferase